jgi:broad specificity phosphatase PhoE
MNKRFIRGRLDVKTIEIRRHSKRGKDKGLTEEGRRIASRASATLTPPYALCISSPKKRARETMEAFGFRDYEEDERFTTIQSPTIEELEEELQERAEEKGISLLEAMFLVDEAKEALKKWGRKYLEAIIDVSRRLNDGEHALVVSHGGSIEPAALLFYDEFDLAKIGGPLGYCEGISFCMEDGKLVRVKVIRI